jgi:hypothetical protein
VLDRDALGTGARAWMFHRQLRLELAVRARRVLANTDIEAQEQEKVRCTTSMLG